MHAPPPAPAALPERLPSLEALRALALVGRLGSLERAAAQLHITASAVAKRLATLETQLGVALVERGPRGLRGLTPAAHDYLAHAGPLLQQLAELPWHRAARALQAPVRLRLSAPPTFARLVLVPALPALARAEPNLELELLVSAPWREEPAATADLAVRHGQAPEPAQRLLDDVLLPLASPQLLPAGQPLAQARDLDTLPLLRTPVQAWRPWFQAAGLHAAEPERGPRLVDLGLVLEAAVAGQGVALMRASLARRALQCGELLPVLGAGHTPWIPATTHYWLETPATDPGRQQALQALASWVHQASRQAAAQGLEQVSGPG
ncbi:LysR substrate-binding domain-containing protein [Ideonella livida]|uniref:LysR family transcriptional regulator n=1 Tax=Ideonella livida TaxID=2707176 RepID=A0A7C9TK23_9BURK|nr:LysR substrate-binding domain-containing protein [Ideonella livida]NDY91562.1 LysR family transcriptional regulator [Ideonella livida]